MKFENIKVGDTVMHPKGVNGVGWRSVKSFYIGIRVSKVTEKQFEVGGIPVKYRKDNGIQVGGTGYGRPKILPLSEQTCQKKEMYSFINTVNLTNEVGSILDSRDIDRRKIEDLCASDLSELHASVVGAVNKFGIRRSK